MRSADAFQQALMAYTPQTVFVYGTLQPGGTYWPRFCEGKVSAVQAAKVHGRLYDLHQGYPGARFGSESWIYGCVLNVMTEAAFEAIDDLEGYDPERSFDQNEYTRLRIDYFNLDGAAEGQAWAYEINPIYLSRFKGTQILSGR